MVKDLKPKLKTYYLGIISSAWTIKAPNIDVAMVALRLLHPTDAPIACYNSDEQARFCFNCDPVELEDFCNRNRTELARALSTCKSLTPREVTNVL